MKPKSLVKITEDNHETLLALMQESYIDASALKNDAQKLLNGLNSGLKPETIDEVTKITKEKTNLLKIKESSIKLKLEISKLQMEMYKLGETKSNLPSEDSSISMKVDLDDFKNVREEVKKYNLDN